MNLFFRKEIRKEELKYKRGLIYVVVFLLTYFLLLTSIAPKKHNLSVGDIAPVDIKAPIDTIDEIATKEKVQEAIEKAKEEKQYFVKSEVKTQAIENVNKLFNKISSEVSSSKDAKDKLTEVKKIESIRLSDDEYNILLALSASQVTEIQSVAVGALEKVYANNNIEENDYEALQKARGIALEEIQSHNLDIALEETLTTIVHSQIKPNLFIDTEKTEENIKEAEKSVQKEIIKKNQIIVKEGEPVTERQIEILKELGLLSNGITKSYVSSFLALAVLVALILFIQFSYIYKERPDVFKNTKLIILISSVNIIVLGLSMGLNIISPYIIPIVCGAILITILIDYRISLVTNLLNLIFISIITGFNPSIILLSILSIILGSTAVKKVQQRNDIIYSTGYIAVIIGVLALTVGMISSNNLKENIIQTGYTLIGVVLSGILAVGLLPFFESIFDVVTNIKLLELSNPNQPLMKKLDYGGTGNLSS